MKIVETRLIPLDTCCLVQVKKPAEKVNGIIMPEQLRKEDMHATDEGYLVKRGVNAFQDIIDDENRPQIGEKIQFVRHAGRFIEIKDNEEFIFRIIPDKDIFAVERGDE